MENTVVSKVDPFTLDIVKDSLVAIGEEMFYALAHTSMSPVIYEVLDYASGLTDSKGQLLTQGNGVTGFIGMLSFMVRQTIEKFKESGELKPGDIILINDPYGGGGSHLCDVGLVMPIFYEGELIAFSANKAHWTDVGGKDPGSMATDSTEIFQEGLQFPSIKVFNEGKVNQSVVDLIAANVRFPDLSLGDLWAQVAALKTGEKRVQELCKKYGKDVVIDSINHLLDHGEQLALKALKELPKGTFEAVDYIDDDGIEEGPFKVQVKLTITDDEFLCDFRGSHPQVTGSINSSYTGLVSAVRTIYLAVTNPSQDVNDGSFRPLRVLTDEGSIFNAVRPAPVSMYWESMLFGTDLIWKALAPLVPNRLSAGHFLSVCTVILSGKHQDTDERFLIVEPSVGGWGGAEGLDGASGQFCILDGETFNIPVEVCETRNGVLVDEYSLHTDGAGAGEFRGGQGVVRSYRALTDNQVFTASFGRHKYKVWGANGGQDGSTNKFEIKKVNGETDGPFGKYNQYPLNKNDVARLITATGGGYGDPLNRPIEKVVFDVKNEYITVEQAERDYGVIIDPDTLEIKEISKERQVREAG
ncbi:MULTISPECIES: hydantoinase B/oxoprolinase family protein [Cytobacillus]|uniref:hydantoinase B/oxoprolinase family protein n=1 Tax=Cytobacillus TaxID=2675230 RepID=UPI00203C1AC1|nr:hydantoinase B/oxoprolinase family protein [Cytobacillus oceanisediminis]MCM3243096.1 hydantoinase B/oxoprolinase family protein [Cytobacillus oceanisediminis]MDK7665338.1 hydantoinase B/oxoprolinase family protein [Cytobacillus oceanisediminis]